MRQHGADHEVPARLRDCHVLDAVLLCRDAPWIDAAENTVRRIIDQRREPTSCRNELRLVDVVELRAGAVNGRQMEAADDEADSPPRLDGHFERSQDMVVLRSIVGTARRVGRRSGPRRIVEPVEGYPLAEGDDRVRLVAVDRSMLVTLLLGWRLRRFRWRLLWFPESPTGEQHGGAHADFLDELPSLHTHLRHAGA